MTNSGPAFNPDITIITGDSLKSNLRFEVDFHPGAAKPYVVVDHNCDPAEDPVCYSFSSQKKANFFKSDMEREHGAFRSYMFDPMRIGRVAIKHVNVGHDKLIAALDTNPQIVVLNEHGDKFTLALDAGKEVTATFLPEDSPEASAINSDDAHRVTVYEWPSGFRQESAMMFGHLQANFFTPKWKPMDATPSTDPMPTVCAISLPVREIRQLRLLQAAAPSKWGNHPFVSHELHQNALEMRSASEAADSKFDALVGDKAAMDEFVEQIHRYAELGSPTCRSVAADLINLSSKFQAVVDAVSSKQWPESLAVAGAVRDNIEDAIFNLVSDFANVRSVACVCTPHSKVPVQLEFDNPRSELHSPIRVDVPMNDAILGNKDALGAILREFASAENAAEKSHAQGGGMSL